MWMSSMISGRLNSVRNPYHRLIQFFTSTQTFQRLLLFWVVLSLSGTGCAEKVREMTSDPYRSWRIEVSLDGGAFQPLQQELTLFPMTSEYVFRAVFSLMDSTEPAPAAVEEEGSRIFVQSLLTGEIVAQHVLENAPIQSGRLLDLPRDLKVNLKSPSAGGAFLVVVEIHQSMLDKAGTGTLTRLLGLGNRTRIRNRLEARVLFPTPTEGNYRDGWIDGYEIGIYPDPKGKTATPYVRMYPDKYQVPEIFYRVDRETANLYISPRFTLGDFDLNFDYLPNVYPQYMPLDLKLVDKLELLLDRMEAAGYDVSRVEMLAGYRSPVFNSEYKRADEEFSLTEEFSQHLYGRAVDMILDSVGDGKLDDLNQDGKIDIQDARVIMKFVDAIDQEALEGKNELLGGAGVYYRHDIPDREIQTPYIHIDTRGFADNLGRPVRWVGRR